MYGYSDLFDCPYGASALGICTLMAGIGIENVGESVDQGSGMGGDESNGRRSMVRVGQGLQIKTQIEYNSGSRRRSARWMMRVFIIHIPSYIGRP